jgi:hypothetical protein
MDNNEKYPNCNPDPDPNSNSNPNSNLKPTDTITNDAITSCYLKALIRK